MKLERGIDGQLWYQGEGNAEPVWVTRCFPWSEPGRYVSIRNREEEEVALVRDPGELDGSSREALELALAEAGFLLEVTRIEDIDEEVEIRTWKVVTAQGPRSFQTRRDEWPRPVPGGGLLVRDVAGDLFFIRAAGALDPHSRKLLWAFVD